MWKVKLFQIENVHVFHIVYMDVYCVINPYCVIVNCVYVLTSNYNPVVSLYWAKIPIVCHRPKFIMLNFYCGG